MFLMGWQNMGARTRRWLRYLAAVGLYYSGLLWIWQTLRHQVFSKADVCVLGFHRVLTEGEYRQTNSHQAILLKEPTFVGILEYLQAHFRITPVSVLWEQETDAGNGSRPACVLTFDDGWQDNYTTAFPWLKKLRTPATVFLTTGLIDNPGGLWVESLNATWREPGSRERILARLNRTAADLDEVIEFLKQMPGHERDSLIRDLLPLGRSVRCSADRMMSWSEVVEMNREGVDFGGHTVTHPVLVHEDDPTVRRELSSCKQIIEEKLQQRIRAFAYPNGNWNPRIRELVKEAGYDCAFTTDPGWHSTTDDLYSIRRILLHEGNSTNPRGEFSAAMLRLTLASWS